MFSLIALTITVLAERKTIGPCILYDRFCLETIWQRANASADGSTAVFGKDFLGHDWRKSPENHPRKCFNPANCKDSGFALVCREDGTRDSVPEKYKKKYVVPLSQRKIFDDYVTSYRRWGDDEHLCHCRCRYRRGSGNY